MGVRRLRSEVGQLVQSDFGPGFLPRSAVIGQTDAEDLSKLFDDASTFTARLDPAARKAPAKSIDQGASPGWFPPFAAGARPRKANGMNHYFMSFVSTIRYRALPASRCSNALFTSDILKLSVTGAISCRAQKSSIFATVEGLPSGEAEKLF